MYMYIHTYMCIHTGTYMYIHTLHIQIYLLQAFFSGKLKISGNTALAMKLQNVIPKTPKAKL